MDSAIKKLAIGRELAEKGKLADAWDCCEEVLYDSPNHGLGLVLATYILEKAERLPAAYQLAIRASQVAPDKSAVWTNLGRCADELWLFDEATAAYRKAIQLAETDQLKASNLVNLAALYINTGQFTAAEPICREALRLAPDSLKAKGNLGFSLLAQRKWEGWEYYVSTLGTTHRHKIQFKDEPEWDGTPGKTVAIYGEQGLGDEIAFSQMLNDAQKDCKRLVVECTPKLTGLFKRSFPKAHVYGTRGQQRIEWEAEDCALDASLAMGELGRFYRTKDEQFSGKPYLTADPTRRLMWRALFDSKDKPCIGIAWTGGVRHTGAQFRKLTLERMMPIFKAIDAHWVCLQYQDASEELGQFKRAHPDVDIEQYAFGTLTEDYDDTAALVMELDLVVCMQTAVAHLCGGLGKECWVLLPVNSQWRYGEEGERIPWYQSLRVFRQKNRGEWSGPINKVVKELHVNFHGIQGAAKKAA